VGYHARRDSYTDEGEVHVSTKIRAGSCLCGSVKVTLSADPVAVAACHCRDCQKQTGTSFSLVALVPLAGVQVTGELARFDTRGDSGLAVERSFCPKCGSPIRADSDGTRQQGIAIIKAGILDNVQDLIPSLQIYCETEHPWLRDTGAVVRFPRMPPG
jgi:hypothetical protein